MALWCRGVRICDFHSDAQLGGARRLQADFACGSFELRGRGCLFEFEQKMSVLLLQTFTFTTQVFALVAVIDGDELLTRRQDEADGEEETADEQDGLTRERAGVALASHVSILVLPGHSSHLNF